jgi:tetratricopeptide (TPR) repeat protein
MKAMYFFLFLISFMFNSFAQNKTDSLKHKLTLNLPDSTRLQIYFEICTAYLWSNPDSVFRYALPAITLTRRQNYKIKEIVFLRYIGESLSGKGNYYESLKCLLKALQISENLNLPEEVAISNSYIGAMYFYAGNYQKAMEYFYRSKQYPGIFTSGYDMQSDELINGFIGETFFEMHQTDSALIYLQRAYDLDIKRTRQHWAKSYYYLGRIHAEKKQYDIALGFYRIGLKNSGTTADSIEGLLFIAQLYKKNELQDSTRFFAYKALHTMKGKSMLMFEIEAKNLLADSYKSANQIDSAFKYQDLLLSAKDSLTRRSNINQLQSLSFTEQIRQMELEEESIKNKENRHHNIQYAAIAIGIITFLVLFLLLSRSIIVNERWVSFLGILGLLIVFEFINLILHPILENMTHSSPLIMLVILVGIASILIPVHHRMESWVKLKMVEKNKKIRLKTAKKIIERLESNG